MDLIRENVIVTAHNFNITLVGQVWLVDHGILTREELERSQSIFTPAFAQVSVPGSFQLLALEDRVQFDPLCDDNLKGGLIVDRLGRFVGLLPHTPYSGLGLNFVWHYVPGEEQTVRGVGRRLFFKDDSPVSRVFNTEDARFGGYYSKNVLGFRLKLSTGPKTRPQPNNEAMEYIEFSFNYHLDSSNADDICAAMRRWDDVKRDAFETVCIIEAGI